MPRKQNEPAEDNWWYFQQLFEYINKLLERIEQRANFLLVSNSVVGATYFSVLSFFSQDGKEITAGALKGVKIVTQSAERLSPGALLLLFFPGLMILFSIVFSVYTILPVVLDDEIKLNHDFIGKMTSTQYLEFAESRNNTDLKNDFIMEIHVLSLIINIKSKRVGRAARSFLTAMIIMPPIIAIYFAGFVH